MRPACDTRNFSTFFQHLSAGNLIGSEGAAALAPMLEFLPALTALHLDCAFIIYALSSPPQHANSQSVTPSAGNEIGPPGIKVLAPSLTHLTSLQLLALGGERAIKRAAKCH